MGKTIVRNHDLRREIAEYILNCSMEQLVQVLRALETENNIPKFFSCERCINIFGGCGEKNCESRILKYEEMRDS